MTIQQTAEELSQLVVQSDELEKRIDELRELMADEMLREEITRYDHNDFMFIRINGRQEMRVDHREFYELACQHDDINEETLSELTENCIRDRTVCASISIRRPRNNR